MTFNGICMSPEAENRIFTRGDSDVWYYLEKGQIYRYKTSCRQKGSERYDLSTTSLFATDWRFIEDSEINNPKPNRKGNTT